ncbi:O-antigen ligase family protein [Vibrio owensii]|uniref:O-antigen ligase family protein n=1 Tax=Vibrio owensii TaxID=696485 RepID=UPI0040679638
MNLLTKYKLTFLTIVAIPFLNYGVNIGFSLKPYMLLVFLSFLLFPHLNKIKRISLEELLYVTFLVYYLTSALWSSYPEMSIKMVILMLINFVCFFWIRCTLSEAFKKYGLLRAANVFIKANVIIYFIALLLYAYGLMVFIKGGVPEGAIVGSMLVDKGIPRFVAYSFDPNIATIFLSLPLFVSMYIKERDLSISTSFFLFCLLLTWSRAAIIALILIFVIRTIHFMLIARKGRAKKFLVLTFFLLLVGTAFVFLLEHSVIGEMVSKRLDGIQRASGRFDAWENGLKVFFDYPIFGVGIYSFYMWNINLFDDAHHLHNTYLDVLVEGGVIGLTLFLIMMFVVFIRLVLHRERLFSLYLAYLWLFNMILISSLTAISHEGFIFNFVLCSILLSNYKEYDNE